MAPPFRLSVERVKQALGLDQGPDSLSSSVTDFESVAGEEARRMELTTHPRRASTMGPGKISQSDPSQTVLIPSGCARRSSGCFGTAPRHGALTLVGRPLHDSAFALAADVSTRYWALTRRQGLRTLWSDARACRCAPAYCCQPLTSTRGSRGGSWRANRQLPLPGAGSCRIVTGFQATVSPRHPVT